mmetsp:Transcript_13143/g.37306  ORF Transcript_13143/g.37306 Transcript_13143/m.37306 type:complete len:282 (+) Transcript_13143:378-1223(+)
MPTSPAPRRGTAWRASGRRRSDGHLPSPATTPSGSLLARARTSGSTTRRQCPTLWSAAPAALSPSPASAVRDCRRRRASRSTWRRTSGCWSWSVGTRPCPRGRQSRAGPPGWPHAGQPQPSGPSPSAPARAYPPRTSGPWWPRPCTRRPGPPPGHRWRRSNGEPASPRARAKKSRAGTPPSRLFPNPARRPAVRSDAQSGGSGWSAGADDPVIRSVTHHLSPPPASAPSPRPRSAPTAAPPCGSERTPLRSDDRGTGWDRWTARSPARPRGGYTRMLPDAS